MSDQWKPKIWVGILLGVILQSFTFLYLNKPKLFFAYFFLTLLMGIIEIKYGLYVSFIFSIICPMHAYIVTKKYDSSNIRKWYSRWWGIPSILLAGFTIILLVRSFFYEPFSIPSASMVPSINVGDHIIAKKFGYGNYSSFGINLYKSKLSNDIKMTRGKIYLVYPPKITDTPWLERLIAKSGDTVKINGTSVFVNGAELPTKLLSENESFSIFEETSGNLTYKIMRSNINSLQKDINIVVPSNSYFFLGDNRDNSNDSRFWGAVSGSNIVGEIAIIFEK